MVGGGGGGAAMTDSYPGKVDTTRLPEGHEGVGVKKSPPEGDERGKE